MTLGDWVAGYVVVSVSAFVMVSAWIALEDRDDEVSTREWLRISLGCAIAWPLLTPLVVWRMIRLAWRVTHDLYNGRTPIDGDDGGLVMDDPLEYEFRELERAAQDEEST